MQDFEDHKQWTAVKEVCRTLKMAGYQALLAGGCVRDHLMNRTPNDFDIATDAVPDEVIRLFPKALTVGKAFGVTILPYDEFQIEVATFRVDLEYKDGRRPEGVRFATAEEDAKRRDFTVNALFYDPEQDEIIDFVGGRDDIQRRLIRTVGEADRRFDEDKLRLLRAVRFAAQLDFEIAPSTLEAVIRRAEEVTVVSRERVRDELAKLLKTRQRLRGLGLLLSTGLFEALFPELAPQVFALENEWLRRFELEVDCDPLVSWTLFFAPAFENDPDEKALREQHLKPLKFDGKTMDTIGFALRAAPVFLKPDSVRRGELVLLLAHAGARVARKVAAIFENEANALDSAREQSLDRIARQTLSADGTLPEPFIDGDEAKAHGFAPGPEMGSVLKEAYLRQLEGSLLNREAAIKWLTEQASLRPQKN